MAQLATEHSQQDAAMPAHGMNTRRKSGALTSFKSYADDGDNDSDVADSPPRGHDHTTGPPTPFPSDSAQSCL